MKKILPGILIPVIIMAAGLCMTMYNTAEHNVTSNGRQKERTDSTGLIKLTTRSAVSTVVRPSFRNTGSYYQTVSLKV